MDDNDRLKKFESALQAPVEVAKFAPKRLTDVTVFATIDAMRTHAKDILKLCDQADAAINASEDDARKAADSLMDLIKRVK
jgi:hypothetical protein